jgi:lipopolysaccharide/colanic/teichoic acid biosynthesis glycosyltransferase
MLSSLLCEATVSVADVADGREAAQQTQGGCFAAPQVRRRWYLSIKHAAEWFIALTLLVIASPLIVVLAALVRLTSPGPAFYAQTRLGRCGRQFRIYKLRTMRHDAEAHSGPVWACKNDNRITPIGAFLRDTHLDEIPQLWNVLRGEMSLIGPRPERPEIAARIATRVPTFYHRLEVRPGVTGLAQMLLPADDPNDASYNCVRRKLALDLLYVRELNPALELKIAVSTACYFLAAAINAVRQKLLRRYRAVLEQATAASAPDATGELQKWVA